MKHEVCISCGSNDLTVIDSGGYGDVYQCNNVQCKNRFNEGCEPYVQPVSKSWFEKFKEFFKEKQ